MGTEFNWLLHSMNTNWSSNHPFIHSSTHHSPNWFMVIQWTPIQRASTQWAVTNPLDSMLANETPKGLSTYMQSAITNSSTSGPSVKSKDLKEITSSTEEFMHLWLPTIQGNNANAQLVDGIDMHRHFWSLSSYSLVGNGALISGAAALKEVANIKRGFNIRTPYLSHVLEGDRSKKLFGLLPDKLTVIEIKKWLWSTQRRKKCNEWSLIKLLLPNLSPISPTWNSLSTYSSWWFLEWLQSLQGAAFKMNQKNNCYFVPTISNQPTTTMPTKTNKGREWVSGRGNWGQIRQQ